MQVLSVQLGVLYTWTLFIVVSDCSVKRFSFVWSVMECLGRVFDDDDGDDRIVKEDMEVFLI